MCGKGWRCTHKAVDTQGLAHYKRPKAGARVSLFKARECVRPGAERSKLVLKQNEPRCIMLVGTGASQGIARTTRCIHKAVCGHR